MKEVWKTIPGVSGYEVSNRGRIRGCDRMLSDGRAWKGRILKLRHQESGHRRVEMGKGNYRFVHHLVLLAFVGPQPRGTEACHGNGQAADNRPENLRWDTRTANRADMHLHGTAKIGEKNNLAKLSKSDVTKILELSKRGELGKKIAARFDVTPANISAILKGKTWRHIERVT